MAKKKENHAEENTLPIKYNKNYFVVQANELIRSRSDEMTVLEAKLIRLAIAQILKEDTDLRTYTCNISKLADFLGIGRQNIYKEIDDLTTKVMKKLVYVRDKDGRTDKNGNPYYKKFHWVDRAEYRDGEITIRLSEDIKPYLVELNELFTKYGYQEILSLPTNNAIRLYELLWSYSSMQFQTGAHAYTFEGEALDKDEILFTVDFLRDYFNCQDKYPNTGDFVKRIIKAGIDDINEHTVFPCQYRIVKEKNRITKIIFKIGNWPTSEESERLLAAFRERHAAAL